MYILCSEQVKTFLKYEDKHFSHNCYLRVTVNLPIFIQYGPCFDFLMFSISGSQIQKYALSSFPVKISLNCEKKS